MTTEHADPALRRSDFTAWYDANLDVTFGILAPREEIAKAAWEAAAVHALQRIAALEEALEPFEFLAQETEGVSDTDQIELRFEESDVLLGRLYVAAFRRARSAWAAVDQAVEALGGPDAGDMAAFGASEAACILYPGEDQQDLRTAYCAGAADCASIPQPEPAAGGELEALIDLASDLSRRGELLIKKDPGAHQERIESLAGKMRAYRHSAQLCEQTITRLSASSPSPPGLDEPFKPSAYYNADADFVEFFTEDVPCVCKPLAWPFEVHVAMDRSRVVGFRVHDASKFGEHLLRPTEGLDEGGVEAAARALDPEAFNERPVPTFGDEANAIVFQGHGERRDKASSAARLMITTYLEATHGR